MTEEPEKDDDTDKLCCPHCGRPDGVYLINEPTENYEPGLYDAEKTRVYIGERTGCDDSWSIGCTICSDVFPAEDVHIDDDPARKEYAEVSWRIGDLDEYGVPPEEAARLLQECESNLRDHLTSKGNEFLEEFMESRGFERD